MPGANAEARRHGPLEAGSFRVVVCEADGRVSVRDHRNLEQARQHADDAASERWDGIVSAYVVDHGYQIVYTGQHYAERG